MKNRLHLILQENTLQVVLNPMIIRDKAGMLQLSFGTDATYQRLHFLIQHFGDQSQKLSLAKARILVLQLASQILEIQQHEKKTLNTREGREEPLMLES